MSNFNNENKESYEDFAAKHPVWVYMYEHPFKASFIPLFIAFLIVLFTIESSRSFAFFILITCWIFLGFEIYGMQQVKKHRLAKYDSKITATMLHNSGLPISAQKYVTLYYGDDRITFIYENTELTLNSDKIISLDHVFDSRVAASAAVAGKIVTGSKTGALVAASAVSKNILNITYLNKNNKKDIISLTAPGGYDVIEKIIKDYKKNHPVSNEIKKIEL